MRSATFFGLLATTSSLFMSPALAQSPDDHEAPQADRSGGDIIVTARKRDERLIDVPVAVTAFTADTLDRNAATDFSKIAELAPQVSITKVGAGSGATFTIRGISSSPLDAGIEQSVSVNLDGMNISRGRIVAVSIFDLQQVEILKGPQALFFGKNSPAGVISLASAQPTNSLSGYLRGGYEFVADQAIIEGAISGPITDTLKARLAVRYSDQKGWIDIRGGSVANPFTPAFDPVFPTPGRAAKRMPAEESIVSRGVLAWDPTNQFSAKLTAQYGRVDSQGEQSPYEQACFGNATSISTLGNGLGQGGRVADPAADCRLDRSVVYNAANPLITSGFPKGKNGKPDGLLDTFVTTLNMNYSFENFDVTSVTGYYWLDGWGTSANSDGTSFGTVAFYNAEKSHAWTQELRVASSFDGPFNFMIGGFFEDSSRTNSASTYLGYIGADPRNGKLQWYDRLSRNSGKVYSAFVQARYDILSDLELAGGVRYTLDKKRTSLGLPFVNVGAAALYRTEASFIDGSRKDDNFSPEATLTWHPGTNQTVYAAYKTGWKGGGYSSPGTFRNTFGLADITFEPEKASGFEAGYKAKLFNDAVRLELNAYTYKYENLQLSSFDAATVTYFIRNAAAARVKGVEGLIEYRPTPDLTLSANVGYNRARFITYSGASCYTGQTAAQGCATPGGQNLAGRPLPRSPDWNGTVSANYDAHLSQDLVLSFNGSARYSSRYEVSDSQPFYFFQPSFWLLNAGVRLHAAGNSWDIALIGRNLTNEYYSLYGQDKTFGTQGEVSATTARPREFLVQSTFRF